MGVRDLQMTRLNSGRPQPQKEVTDLSIGRRVFLTLSSDTSTSPLTLAARPVAHRSSPRQELGWRELLDVASMQQGRPGGSGAHPARIQVSTSKKPLFFYVNLAKRFLQEHGEVQLSALGLAISSMVTVAEILKSGQWAVERKITTGMDTTDDAGRERPVQKAKMEIIMVKSSQFDALMEASTEQRQQGGSSSSPDPPAGTPPDASSAPPTDPQASGSGEVQGTQHPPVR